MRARLALLCMIAFAAGAAAEVCSPPLRFPWDTRSTFLWSDGPERFPQVAQARWRVISQHRPRPVLGDDPPARLCKLREPLRTIAPEERRAGIPAETERGRAHLGSRAGGEGDHAK